MSKLAKMGFVGFVKFLPKTAGVIPADGLAVRVTSADVKLTQEIQYPDVIDNKVDNTLYQLGPAQVGGSLAFPLVHEGNAITDVQGQTDPACNLSQEASLAANLWQIAVERDEVGRMKNIFDCHIRYADNLGYKYYGCLVNSMTFTINQSEAVNVSCEVIGGAQATNTTGGYGITNLRDALPNANPGGPSSSDALKFLSPARIVTWNDAILSIWKNNSSANSDIVDPTKFLTAQEIRKFTCTVNNNIERFYTLNGTLGPQDIAAKKREISGQLTIMGHNSEFSKWAQSNEDRFTSTSGIGFGYKLGNSTPNQAYWATGLYGVIFEIEEVSLSTGLFETTTKWRALGDCGRNFFATKLGKTSVPTPFLPASDFGSSTSPNYPTFGANDSIT